MCSAKLTRPAVADKPASTSQGVRLNQSIKRKRKEAKERKRKQKIEKGRKRKGKKEKERERKGKR